MEEAVLGACMLERGAADILSDILKPECFYVEAHQTVFRAILQLTADFQPIDILTVVEYLRKVGELEITGGPYFITKLTNKVVSAANIEAHARIILQKHIARELIRIGGEIVNDGFEDTGDVFDMLDRAEAQLFNLTTGHVKKDFKPLKVEYDKTIKVIMERMLTKQDITGVPSGFPSLDKVTHGWQDTDLIIIAARPSVGKTAFALNLARNAAINDIRPTSAAVFCLEMSAGQLVFRIIAAESDVKLDYLVRGKIEEWELTKVRNACEITALQERVFIDDTPGLNIFELRAKARRLVQKHGVGVIIIDYLQLMTAHGDGNREQQVSSISRSLKALAKELHVPVIALSQLSRDVEKRKGSAQLSDLRESGAIEQDADMVAFLSRPDYQLEVEEADPATRGMVDVKIAKHRNGKLATIPLEVDLEKQKFKDPMIAMDDRRQMTFVSKQDNKYTLELPPEPAIDDSDDLPF